MMNKIKGKPQSKPNQESLEERKLKESERACDYLIICLGEELLKFYTKKQKSYYTNQNKEITDAYIIKNYVVKDIILVSMANAVTQAKQEVDDVNKLIQFMQVIENIGAYSRTTLPDEMLSYPKTSQKALKFYQLIKGLK